MILEYFQLQRSHRAADQLLKDKQSEVDSARALAELAEAAAQLRMIEKFRKGKV